MWLRPGVSITTANGQTAADQLAAICDSNYGTALRAWMCADANYFGVIVEISLGGLVFTSANTDTAGAGSRSGDTSPEFAAVVIRKRTDTPGKTGRGRWFIGCVPEVLTTNGVLSNTGIAAANTLRSAYGGDQVTALATWGAYLHSKKDDALYSISSTHTESILATQRRRRVRPLF
jgi:hypothetical protein